LQRKMRPPVFCIGAVVALAHALSSPCCPSRFS
jgi:hypothetical protein